MMRPRRSSLPTMWLLLAVALLLRAGVPTGWMPVADEAGGVRIMLCSGSGAVELASPDLAERFRPHSADAAQDSSSQGHGGDHDAPRDPCPYAVALAKALNPGPPVVVDILAPVSAIPPDMPVSARIAAHRGIRPPARGPPHFA